MNLKNMSEMSKKLIKYAIFAVVGLILVFVIIFIINTIKGEKLSFEKIEKKMVEAANAYYKDNQHLLINESELDINTLVEKEYMKDLSKYTGKDVECNGKVVVLKNESYYTLVPKLYCGGDYSTNDLVEKITSESNIVTTGDGLYNINNEYIFRGEKLNNYVTFAGTNWRILRITKDNNIRLIQDDYLDSNDWDNRYNSSTKSNSGINDFNISRIKDDLEKIYNGKMFNEKNKAKIVPTKLCIGKRAEDDKNIDGTTECKTTTEEYYPLGLIQANEYVIASIDKECLSLRSRSCTNYNFLSYYEKNFWTITADAANTSNVYYIDYLPDTTQARNPKNIKLVINVSGFVNYIKGNGTLENPYIID